ncbi:retrotransposon protein, putative, ty1-copia subclass [Tanacetum coccineum]
MTTLKSSLHLCCDPNRCAATNTVAYHAKDRTVMPWKHGIIESCASIMFSEWFDRILCIKCLLQDHDMPKIMGVIGNAKYKTEDAVKEVRVLGFGLLDEFKKLLEASSERRWVVRSGLFVFVLGEGNKLAQNDMMHLILPRSSRGIATTVTKQGSRDANCKMPKRVASQRLTMTDARLWCNSATWISRVKEIKDEAIDKFVLYKTEVENQLGKKIKVVRSDRGGEYVAPFAELCAKHGIRHEFTAPYSPQQNGIAERKNRTLKEMVTAMLISSGMSQDMWGEAILTATYLLNKIPRKEKEETPYELWMGRKPSYQYLRVWGCLAMVAVPTPKAQKIGLKYVDCIFIGYAKKSTAYRFIVHELKNPDIQYNTIMESRNASFFENIFPCLSKETGSSSRRLDDEVVHVKRHTRCNDLHDERQDQTTEEDALTKKKQ